MHRKSVKTTIRSRLHWLAFIGLVAYATINIGCASCQRKMIYYPPHFTTEQVDQAAKAAGFDRWYDSSGQVMGIKRPSLRQPVVGSVLITYGNASWSVGCTHYADEIQQLAALDVFVLEYPGYANRAGSPSQKTIFQAADMALNTLGTNRPVYLVGESLGSGVASYLAGTHPNQIAGVILLSPFNSMTSVAQYHMPVLPVGLFLVDRYPSQDYLRSYQGPVAIMVDGQDRVVPEKFGRQLYDRYTGPKQLWCFPDGNHIAIMESPKKFWSEVLDFWRANQVLKADKS